MKAVRTIATISLMLGFAPGLAFAANTRPLQLELPQLSATAPAAGPTTRTSAFERGMAPRPGRATPLFQRERGTHASNGNRALQARAQDLGRQALENVLDADGPGLDEARGEGQLQLKFNKRGNAFKDLNRSYREMCDRVSAKIWDDPNGKRIRFDVAGKPGVGFEIPVGHRKR